MKESSDKDFKTQALEYHCFPKPGKTEVVPTKPFSTPEDLALAYSPGVAYPCLEIASNSDESYRYTNRGNTIAVISNGTAVLGLGNIGADAAKPVMEGKAMLFKVFGGLESIDIEINETDPQKFVEIVKAIAPSFGAINLEDIKAPECFDIEKGLIDSLDIPVMHDDQHGTAVIVGAATINAAQIQNRQLETIRLVVNGAGAAAMACTRLLVDLGIRKDNIVMCDSKGIIRADRKNLTPGKAEFATARTDVNTLEEALVGADMFLGLSVADVLTAEMLRSMAKRPIVFALANPNPEIERDVALAAVPDMIFATGRSDYPNQINNVLGFPYLFRGALDCRATVINKEMKLAAAHAIAALAREKADSSIAKLFPNESLEFGPDYILPKPFDRRLICVVPPAIVKAAEASGVARKPISDLEGYGQNLRSNVAELDERIRRYMAS